MGYTHYWYRPIKNAGSAYMFGKLSLDAKTIIKQAESEGIRIRNGNGEFEPDFNEAYFSINGDASHYIEGRDLAHETFMWHGMLPIQPNHRKDEPEYFAFCKTAMKPYDAVVGAILIRAKIIYGSCVRISSDGDWHGDWSECTELYERTFDEIAPCPFNVSRETITSYGTL